MAQQSRLLCLLFYNIYILIYSKSGIQMNTAFLYNNLSEKFQFINCFHNKLIRRVFQFLCRFFQFFSDFNGLWAVSFTFAATDTF